MNANERNASALGGPSHNGDLELLNRDGRGRSNEFPAPPALADNAAPIILNDDEPLALKYAVLGQHLAAAGDLYRRPYFGGGLWLASMHPNVPATQILEGKQLGPLVADRLRALRTKNGKLRGGRISNVELSMMLNDSPQNRKQL
jgi:hypothetical protein